MSERLYLMLSNNGDGSSSANWFHERDVTPKQLLALEEDDPETWAGSEGYETYIFPDNFDFKAAGFRLSTLPEPFDGEEDD